MRVPITKGDVVKRAKVSETVESEIRNRQKLYMSSMYGKFGQPPVDPSVERSWAVAELARAAAALARSLAIMSEALREFPPPPPPPSQSLADRELANIISDGSPARAIKG